MDGPLVSLVVPAYCESSHLAASLAAMRQEVSKATDDFEIIVVDDGSTDPTWSVLAEQARGDDKIRGLRLSRNFGKESAIAAGLSFARGQATVVLDADLQHPPALIPKMLEIWRKSGADVVRARKLADDKEPWAQHTRRRIFNAIFTRLSGVDLADASDFMLISRRVRQTWLAMEERNLFFRGMIAWLGFKVETIPFAVADRSDGKSKWSARALAHLAATALTSFSTLPLRLAMLVGVVFLFVAIAGMLYSLVYKLLGLAKPGFTTVIILQFFIGSLILLSLGVIGEYLGRIYEEVKRRPRFIVSESTGAPHPSPKVVDTVGELDN
jgi:polyisoprenyl-phosphate glycosyltransferase